MALRNKIFRIPKETFTYPYFTLNVTNSGENWNASATTASGITIQSIKWYVDGQLLHTGSGTTIDSDYSGSLLLVDAKDSRGLKMHYISVISYGPDTNITFELEDSLGFIELEDSIGYLEIETIDPPE